jgi:hypothetical protein
MIYGKKKRLRTDDLLLLLFFTYKFTEKYGSLAKF